MRLLLLPLIGIASCALASAAQDPVPRSSYDEWRVIYHDGERLGYERTRFRHDGETLSIFATAVPDSARSRGGVVLDERSAFVVDTSGVIRSFTQRSVSRPGRFVEYIGNVDGEQFTMTTKTPGRTFEREFVVPPETRAEIWFQWHLRQDPMPQKSRTRFRVFRPGIGSDTSQVQVTTGSWRRVQLPSGARRKLLPMTLKRTSYSGESQQLYVDGIGQLSLIHI